MCRKCPDSQWRLIYQTYLQQNVRNSLILIFMIWKTKLLLTPKIILKVWFKKNLMLWQITLWSNLVGSMWQCLISHLVNSRLFSNSSRLRSAISQTLLRNHCLKYHSFCLIWIKQPLERLVSTAHVIFYKKPFSLHLRRKDYQKFKRWEVQQWTEINQRPN